MTSARDPGSAIIEAHSIRGRAERRTWAVPAVRRMSAGIAEAGGGGPADGMIGES